MDEAGIKFLDKLYGNLYMSDVVQHTRENSDSRIETIKKYLERLEKLHEFANTDARKEYVLNMYFDKYVIKEKDIPYGYDKKQVIDAQKKSLTRWIEYLTNPTTDYPMWAKYWAFQGMLKMGSYDETKAVYLKRDKKTITPFVEANPELIAKSIGTIIKLINGEEISSDIEEKLSKTDSFSKIYITFEKKLKTNIVENSVSDEGKWIKYNQGSKEDAIALTKSLENKNTHWCTADESTAIKQLCGPYGNSPDGGDFYVYYTKDETGMYSIPRIAIRCINNNYIAEIRGVGDGQNLEDGLDSILENKLKEMTFMSKESIKKELDTIEGLRELTRIGIKTEKKEELSSEELSNLYSKVYGFGWVQDPRVEKIQKKRNIIDDFNQSSDDIKLKILCSRSLPKTVKIDNEKLLREAAKNGASRIFQHASDRLLDDKDFVKFLLQNGSVCISYLVDYTLISKRLLDDEEIVKLIIKDNVKGFQYASDRLKDNEELVSSAIIDGSDNFSEEAFEFASDRLKDDKEFILKFNREHNIQLLIFASDRLKDDKEVVIELSKKDPLQLHFASDRLQKDKDFIKEAIKIDTDFIFSVPKEPIIDDEETILYLIKNQSNPEILEHISKSYIFNNEEAVLDFIEKSRSIEILDYTSTGLKDNADFILKVLGLHEDVMKYASDRLKNDKDFMLDAIMVASLSNILVYAPEELREDKDFMLKAINIDTDAFKYASADLRDSEGFLLDCIRANENILSVHISKKLRDNREFMMKVVNINGEYIKFCSDRLRNDKGLVIAAIRNNLYAMLYISDDLIEDEDISKEIQIAKDKKKKQTK